MFTRLDMKDIAYNMRSVIDMSSALYLYIAEAYKVAGLFERTMFGPQ
jgi:hypothetical protein